MKNYLIAIACASFVISIAADTDDRVLLLMSESSDRSTRLKFEISKPKLDSLAKWSPTSTSIPLQPQRAAALALARWKALYSTDTSACVFAMDLAPIGGTHLTKWMYYVTIGTSEDIEHVTYRPPKSAGVLVVLLDGTVVEPVVDPRPVPRLEIK